MLSLPDLEKNELFKYHKVKRLNILVVICLSLLSETTTDKDLILQHKWMLIFLLIFFCFLHDPWARASSGLT